jgi:hypothetical protein
MIIPDTPWVWSCSLAKGAARPHLNEGLPLELVLGSEVAIVPGRNSPPAEAQELATVARVSSQLIELSDGRLYAIDGEALSLASDGYIVLATDEHRATVVEREFGQRWTH